MAEFKSQEEIKAEIERLNKLLQLGILPDDGAVAELALKVTAIATDRKISVVQVVNALKIALNLDAAPAKKGPKAGKPRAVSLRSALIAGLKAKGLSGWGPATPTADIEKMYAKNYGDHALEELKKNHSK